MPCNPFPEFLIPPKGKISGLLDGAWLMLTVTTSNDFAILFANSISCVYIDACKPYSDSLLISIADSIDLKLIIGRMGPNCSS